MERTSGVPHEIMQAQHDEEASVLTNEFYGDSAHTGEYPGENENGAEKQHRYSHYRAWVEKKMEARRMEEEQQLTFKPKLHEYKGSANAGAGSADGASRFDRLYKDARKRHMEAKVLKAQAEEPQGSFQPQLVTRSSSRSKRAPSPQNIHERLHNQTGAGKAKPVAVEDPPFHPAITRKALEISRNQSADVADRLYQKSFDIKDRMEKKRQEAEVKQQNSEDCTFSPKLPANTRSLSANRARKSVSEGEEPPKSAPDRLLKYEEQKRARLEMLRKTKLEVENGEITFSPQITSASSQHRISYKNANDQTVFDRLIKETSGGSSRTKVVTDPTPECTFKPTISKKSRDMTPNRTESDKSLHERLHEEAEKKKRDMEVLTQHVLGDELKESTFSPVLVSKQPAVLDSRKPVFERLADATDKMTLTTVMSQLKDELELSECTFQPTLTAARSTAPKSDVPVHLRLNAEAERVRQQAQLREEQRHREDQQNFKPVINEYHSDKKRTGTMLSRLSSGSGIGPASGSRTPAGASAGAGAGSGSGMRSTSNSRSSTPTQISSRTSTGGGGSTPSGRTTPTRSAPSPTPMSSGHHVSRSRASPSPTPSTSSMASSSYSNRRASASPAPVHHTTPSRASASPVPGARVSSSSASSSASMSGGIRTSAGVTAAQVTPRTSTSHSTTITPASTGARTPTTRAPSAGKQAPPSSARSSATGAATPTPGAGTASTATTPVPATKRSTSATRTPQPVTSSSSSSSSSSATRRPSIGGSSTTSAASAPAEGPPPGKVLKGRSKAAAATPAAPSSDAAETTTPITPQPAAAAAAVASEPVVGAQEPSSNSGDSNSNNPDSLPVENLMANFDEIRISEVNNNDSNNTPAATAAAAAATAVTPTTPATPVVPEVVSAPAVAASIPLVPAPAPAPAPAPTAVPVAAPKPTIPRTPSSNSNSQRTSPVPFHSTNTNTSTSSTSASAAAASDVVPAGKTLRGGRKSSSSDSRTPSPAQSAAGSTTDAPAAVTAALAPHTNGHTTTVSNGIASTGAGADTGAATATADGNNNNNNTNSNNNVDSGNVASEQDSTTATKAAGSEAVVVGEEQ